MNLPFQLSKMLISAHMLVVTESRLSFRINPTKDIIALCIFTTFSISNKIHFQHKIPQFSTVLITLTLMLTPKDTESFNHQSAYNNDLKHNISEISPFILTIVLCFHSPFFCSSFYYVSKPNKLFPMQLRTL